MRRLSSLQNIRRSVRNLVAPAELDPADAYELWSSTYDDAEDNAVLNVERPITQQLITQSGLTGKSVLDMGCGTGRHLQTILQTKPKMVVGVDLSPAMLQFALKKALSNTTTYFQVAESACLPFRDATFDVALSTLVLAHVQNLNAAISELSRVLRSGGTLLISCFHPFGKLLSWKRSFQAQRSSDERKWFSARYYLHLHSDYFNALTSAKMEIVKLHEPVIDETVKPFYERAGRLDMFDRFKGYPLLLFFVARKQ